MKDRFHLEKRGAQFPSLPWRIMKNALLVELLPRKGSSHVQQMQIESLQQAFGFERCANSLFGKKSGRIGNFKIINYER